MTRRYLLLILCSCAGRLPAPTIAPADSDRILSAIEKDDSKRASMGADGTISVRRSGVPVKGQLSVVADAKGRVRVDVSTEVGNLLFAFASDGKTVTLLDLQQRRFYRAAAGPNDLAPVGLKGMSSVALARLFLARQPCTGARVISLQPELVVEKCLGGTLTSTYARFNEQSYLLKHVKLAAEQGFEAKLLAHTSAGLARRLELSTPDGDVLVQLNDVDINPTLNDAVFQLEPPPGI